MGSYGDVEVIFEVILFIFKRNLAGVVRFTTSITSVNLDYSFPVVRVVRW